MGQLFLDTVRHSTALPSFAFNIFTVTLIVVTLSLCEINPVRVIRTSSRNYVAFIGFFQPFDAKQSAISYFLMVMWSGVALFIIIIHRYQKALPPGSIFILPRSLWFFFVFVAHMFMVVLAITSSVVLEDITAQEKSDVIAKAGEPYQSIIYIDFSSTPVIIWCCAASVTLLITGAVLSWSFFHSFHSIRKHISEGNRWRVQQQLKRATGIQMIVYVLVMIVPFAVGFTLLESFKSDDHESAGGNLVM